MRSMLVAAIVFATLTDRLHGEVVQDSTSQWKVGVASMVITPDRPLRMAGYAGRTDPADGTIQDLFAKCIT